jgi:hypothetical protein
MTEQTEQANREVLAAIWRMYQKDWVFFIEHGLGHYTWSKQREIIRAVQNNERVLVHAAHSSSKTFTAAELAATFFNLFEEAKVITTAPTWPQVEKLLWSEISKMYRTSRIGLEGECLQAAIKHPNAEHFAVGFSTDKPTRAEGWHAPAILFIFDEAKGLPGWLWDSAEGSMTGGFCRWLAITTTDGVNPGEPFYKAAKNEKSEWKKIHISANDSPYVTGEKFRHVVIPDPSRPDKFKVEYVDPGKLNFQLASPKWIEHCKNEWGQDSILFMTKVLGEIIDSSPDTIMKLSDVIKMFANHEKPGFDDGAVEIGCDVARFGDDSTDAFKRKGMKVIDFKERTKQDTQQTAEMLVDMAGGDKNVPIKVDDTGVGGGVTDRLRHLGFHVIPINFGEASTEPDKYPNVISEMWFEGANKVASIACPHMERLQVELVNRKQKRLDNKGRRVIESKDEYKKRGFRSPDQADAFLLTFHNPKITTPKLWRIA